MARRRFGVALLVPPPAAVEIDGLRRALGDGALGRIVPHLTLVPPVNVREDDVAVALTVLREAAATTAPVRLVLGPPASFLPVTPAVYLAVGDGGEEGQVGALHRLRVAVLRGPLARALTHDFVPHVTLADDAEPATIPDTVALLGGYRVEVTFDRMTLLEERRTDRGRTWETVTDVALAAPVVIGRGGLELVVTTSQRLDPQVEAFATREWAVLDTEQFGPGGDAAGRPLALSARRDGRVVGVANGWVRGGIGYVAGLVVAPGERRQGIGPHLLGAFGSAAAADGATELVVRTTADEPAESFYRHLGWVPEARFSWVHGRDVVQLRRRLATGAASPVNP